MSRRRRRRTPVGLSKMPEGDPMPEFEGYGNCEVCEMPLFTEGGYAGTGMCGPCCTGEADTVGEF